jgi:hypothetical protein
MGASASVEEEEEVLLALLAFSLFCHQWFTPQPHYPPSPPATQYGPTICSANFYISSGCLLNSCYSVCVARGF